MSSCFSGGGRAYRLDLNIVKSRSTSSISLHSSSPSSTLSDSSNSPIAISTRKPRTPRKRPNQTYNEVAALLSTAYPKIFSTKHLTKPCKFSKSQHTFLDEPPELLLPFPATDTSGFLLHQPILVKPHFEIEPKVLNSLEKQCQSPVESDSCGNYPLDFCDGYQEDFDIESMLDEEIEEGIDSIMGNLSVKNDLTDESNTCIGLINTSYGYPMGLGFSGNFEFSFGMRRGVRALRNVDESNWWSSPTVNVLDITPKFKKISVQKKKKKVEKPVKFKTSESPQQENSVLGEATEQSIPELNSGPRLKLNYDKVLDAWSDRGWPFVEKISGWETSGNDIHARLSKYPVAAGPPHIIVDQVMMLIQSSLPSSIEAAFSFTSDHEEKELLCDWTSGAETWQECPRCDKHPNGGHERVVSFTKRKNDCCSCSLNCLSSSSQQSTVATMSENSTPTFVYRRRMLQKGNASVSPARSNCVSVISSEGPSVTAKDHVVSLVEVKTEVVRASVMLPAECNRGALVSKSASMGGCSLDDELGSVEGPKADMLKIVDICFVNDSCSSSKLNMDLCAATLKIEVDDTGECSSSNAFVMDLQDDISKKDACISILKGLGLHKGVWTINNRASPEGLGINCYCSCWRSCKVCDQSEITLKMLICDQCEEAFHVSCCYPRLKKIPHDEWFCHSCLKKGCKILESTSSSEMSRCRNATSKGVLGPIAVMLDDTEPYTTNVRIGREFQAEVPDWSGPIAIEVDNIGEPLEINPSEGVSFQERSSGKFYRLSSICNWLQCREVICGIGEGVNGTVCGKWRRAPLFEVQTDNWECFRSFLWDPTQADCAVPPELDTDQVVKELKYIEMLRPRLAGKKRKLGCEKSVDSNGPTEDVRNMDTL